MITLQIIWFLLIGTLFIGYAILDGFDLGVGFWHLFSKDENEKRIYLNSIGPFWDGNEVWLLTAGGSLFAAFPIVYATVFSGFYLALMLVLYALIARAIAIEFRNKHDSKRWRKISDIAFGTGSLVTTVLLGVALGNIIRGIPINEIGNFSGTFFQLLNPFSLLIGITSLILLSLHGAIYIAVKTEDQIQNRAIKRANAVWFLFLFIFILCSIWTFSSYPHLPSNFIKYPIFLIGPILGISSIFGIKIFLLKKNYIKSFLFSSLTIAGLVLTSGFSIFPNMVPAINKLNHSLTIYNSSSSFKTLMIMLVIALIGMPMVLTYTIYIYKVFKGKVDIEQEHY